MIRKIFFLQLTLLCATQHAQASVAKEKERDLANHLTAILQEIRMKNPQETGTDADKELPHYKDLDTFLTQNPAYINASSKEGKTVLMTVANMPIRLSSTLKLLLGHRARPDDRCKNGLSALDYAIDGFPYHPYFTLTVDTTNIETLYAVSSAQTRKKALDYAKSHQDLAFHISDGFAGEKIEFQASLSQLIINRSNIYRHILHLSSNHSGAAAAKS